MAGPSWLAWAFASVVIISGRLLPDPAGGFLAAASPERSPGRRHPRADGRRDGRHAGAAAGRVLDRRLGGRLRDGRRLVRLAGDPRVPGRPTVGGRPGHHLQHVLACGAMLYMFLAAATVAKAAAGGSAMGGMAGGAAHFRTLALVLAFALFGYVVWTADRLSSLAPVAALAARSAPVRVLAGAGAGGGTSIVAADGEGSHGTPGDGGQARAAGPAGTAVPSPGGVLRDSHGRDYGLHVDSDALNFGRGASVARRAGSRLPRPPRAGPPPPGRARPGS